MRAIAAFALGGDAGLGHVAAGADVAVGASGAAAGGVHGRAIPHNANKIKANPIAPIIKNSIAAFVSYFTDAPPQTRRSSQEKVQFFESPRFCEPNNGDVAFCRQLRRNPYCFIPDRKNGSDKITARWHAHGCPPANPAKMLPAFAPVSKTKLSMVRANPTGVVSFLS